MSPWLTALRPRQWIKNGVVLAAVVFAGRLSDPWSIRNAFIAFSVFCVLSSSGYLLNDIVDAERDRAHPLRRHRPIAAGLVARQEAIVLAGVLAGSALTAAVLVSPSLGVVSAWYLMVTASYSLVLKQIVIADVVAVSTGFLIRAIAGAVAIDVPVSFWLGLLTSLLALFIILAKRLADPTPPYSRLFKREGTVRPLRLAVLVVAVCAMATYAGYAFSAANLPPDHVMLITVPLVGLGLARYVYLASDRGMTQGRSLTFAPEEALFRDIPLLLTVGAWVLTSVLGLYWIR